MRLVLTRPEREASRWAQALHDLGHEVLCLPLIAVGPAPDAQALSQARALALGARGTLVGRAYLYGLMAGGADGVRRVVSILEKDLRTTMQLLGVSTVAELEPGHVTLR